jgi:hypothetical protein
LGGIEMDKDDILIEYFKSLREEIHIRIRQHTQLVWIKIVSLGGIISFFINQQYGDSGAVVCEKCATSMLYFVWIVPLAAVIMDMLIAGNLRGIFNLGTYIKKYIEEMAFKKTVTIEGFKFWEEDTGQGKPKGRNYTEIDLLAVWMFTLASAVFAFLLRWQIGFTQIDKILTLVCIIGISGSLVCLGHSIMKKGISDRLRALHRALHL